MQQNLDTLWIVLCSALVFIMQAGFLCLESGLTRRKNSINVAIKNLADFCLTTMIFWLFGFGLMFGTSAGGWVGADSFALDMADHSAFYAAFFIFQVMFCGASITIMSGAIAERVRFSAYLLITLLIAGVVYPVFGHWAWGGLGQGETTGWLGRMGFVDFAGSTVVHSVGGWAALVVLLIIGPRAGRFAEADGRPIKIPGSSLSQATLGTILLFVGWLGFNGGSTLALNAQVPLILVNTLIAGSMGAVSAGLLGYAVESRLNVRQFINGCLGGLVAVTANCFAVGTPEAVLIGLIGGMVAVSLEQLLEYLRIDDVVGAIPVHLGAGIWGTLAVGLYGDLEVLGTGLSRLQQIGVQCVGILACAAWTLAIALPLLWVINRVYPLRVSLDHELLGLNLAEHGESEDGGPAA